jgi:hypothetical protein
MSTQSDETWDVDRALGCGMGVIVLIPAGPNRHRIGSCKRLKRR